MFANNINIVAQILYIKEILKNINNYKIKIRNILLI